MHPADIQAALKKRGITQKQISQEEGVSEFFISALIRKKTTSDRVMKKVARRIGLHHTEVFPEYYFNPNRRKRAE